jgi:putative ABC transport system permease protein
MLHDLRHSLRLLRRTPGFSAAAIVVLALGIGANTAVFSLVNTLVLQPRPGRIDEAFGVFTRDASAPDRFRDFSYPQYVDLRDRTGVFGSLMAHTFTTIGVRDGEVMRQSFASLVSANYFDTLGVRMAAGRAFSADEERPGAGVPVAIAAYVVWRRAGLNPAFVGSTVRLNGRDFAVVGVAPKGFAGTMTLVSPEWWLPTGAYDIAVNEMFRPKATGLEDRAHYAFNLVGVLKPGVARAAAERALDAAVADFGRAYPATDRDRAHVLAPLPRMSVSSRPQVDNGPATLSLLLAFMAALVLVVACLNLANLLLARGVARRREIAIRQALGSSRGRIVRQLLVEGLVLSSLGASLGSLVAWWATQVLGAWFTSVIPLGLEIVIEPSARMFAAAAAFALFSTVCFALGPAWAVTRPVVQNDLKGEPARITRRLGTGPALVIAQVAVSLALVAAGGLFARAAIRAASADPGFALDHQLLVTLDPGLAGYDHAQTRALYARVINRVRSIAGVERAGLASTVPFGEFSEGREVHLPGDTRPRHAEFVIVTSDYFETLRLPILRGRAFTPAEDQESSTAVKPAIIDSLLATQLFGDADPIGRALDVPAREGDTERSRFTVVGVVPPTRHDLFVSDVDQPHLYAAYGSLFRGRMLVHVRTSPAANQAAMVGTIQRELKQLDPRLPILAARTMIAHRDASISEWAVRAAATLFTAFGALALLLATIGVYGLKAYDVSRRTREIGIRMALGATSADVQRLVMREGVRTTAVGLTLGLALAAGVGKLVSGLLYRVSPFDPVVLALAAAALSTAAMLASYLPARRATRVAPTEALRAE